MMQTLESTQSWCQAGVHVAYKDPPPPSCRPRLVWAFLWLSEPVHIHTNRFIYEMSGHHTLV